MGCSSRTYGLWNTGGFSLWLLLWRSGTTGRVATSGSRARRFRLPLLLARPPLWIVLANEALHFVAGAIGDGRPLRNQLALGNQPAHEPVQRRIFGLQRRAIAAAVADIPLHSRRPIFVERVPGVAVRRAQTSRLRALIRIDDG